MIKRAVTKKLNLDSVEGILKSLAVLAVVGTGIAFLVKLTKKNKPKIFRLPSGGGGIVPGFDPSDLAGRLYRKMKGVRVQELLNAHPFGWVLDRKLLMDDRDLVLQEFAELPTDDQFVAVINTFNAQFAEGESLYGWVNSEFGVNENVLNSLNARFHKLRIT